MSKDHLLSKMIDNLVLSYIISMHSPFCGGKYEKDASDRNTGF